jgi:hypothetical protein
MFRITNDYKLNLKNKIKNLEKLTLEEKGLNDNEEVIADYPVLRKLSPIGLYELDFWQEGDYQELMQIKKELENQRNGKRYVIEFIPRRRQIYDECIKELHQEDIDKQTHDPEYDDYQKKQKQYNLDQLKEIKKHIQNRDTSKIKEKTDNWRITNFKRKKELLQITSLATSLRGAIIKY